MSLISKYGGVLLLIASVAVALALIIDAFTGVGTRGVAASYCTSLGYSYEERSFNGVLRGFCVFSVSDCSVSSVCEPGINCISGVGSETIKAASECLAVEFYNGSCSQCSHVISDCSSYSGLSFCNQDLVPVCARVRVIDAFESRNWGNACSACFNSRETEVTTWFVNGTC